ncbi:MAG: hypothetical protein PHD38_01825 [Mesotoga sp.]|jgi:hypothetical protein|uniref:hypothetical protein n=1 Tax=unclassified Mesotoga TaxID=1184398 RepID=UPI000EF2717C|nr:MULTISPECIES: hypothetical protein [unclassified Mesotoga]MDI9368454.1 hypothetical protein [Thermotogota bacterium]NLT44448.1 hypothetical protein [Thermotogaceae bacterium]MDD2333123.1 hypothetical protein [Mesotoga sp.]MDD3681331.1 hypothetical protein [Mesotoga sp.]MDD4206433.1 hypothetical protein [Mesotoga sp.]
MSKKDFLRKLLSEGRSADDIANLFGITAERMEKYLEDPSQSRLAVAEIKTELRRLESLPLDTKEDILLFSFKVILESINFLFSDIERTEYDKSEKLPVIVRKLIDGAYLLLAISRLEKVGESLPSLVSDQRFLRACQNKTLIAERLMDLAEMIDRQVGR